MAITNVMKDHTSVGQTIYTQCKLWIYFVISAQIAHGAQPILIVPSGQLCQPELQDRIFYMLRLSPTWVLVWAELHAGTQPQTGHAQARAQD